MTRGFVAAFATCSLSDFTTGMSVMLFIKYYELNRKKNIEIRAYTFTLMNTNMALKSATKLYIFSYDVCSGSVRFINTRILQTQLTTW